LKTEILNVTFGEKPKKPRKNLEENENQYFTKIEQYLYKFVANESSFGIYTQKTKEILFEFDNVFKIL
jgi:hypothetical protein